MRPSSASRISRVVVAPRALKLTSPLTMANRFFTRWSSSRSSSSRVRSARFRSVTSSQTTPTPTTSCVAGSRTG